MAVDQNIENSSFELPDMLNFVGPASKAVILCGNGE